MTQIIDAGYTEKVSVAQQKSSYPYTKVTPLSYQILGKKDTSWLIDTKLQAKELAGVAVVVHRGSDRFCVQGGKFLQSNDQEGERDN